MRTDDHMRGPWKCSGCGVIGSPADDCDPAWRWAGDHWQHHDGHPTGHVRAERVVDWEAFARNVLDIYFERDCGGVDGDELQEAGITSGVLVAVQVTEPCDADCNCVDAFGYFKAPIFCYRLVGKDGKPWEGGGEEERRQEREQGGGS